MSDVRVRVGFIGGGRVTRCLAIGWQRAGFVPGSIVVHDPDDTAIAKLRSACHAVAQGSLADASGADVVFLALHPPAFAAALPAVAPHLAAGAVVVSLAPKVGRRALEAGLGTHKVVRMIPNAPSIVGRGFNPVAGAEELGTNDRAVLAALFDPWGAWPEVAESTLEAYAILSGMGPTYYWYQWQALRDLAGQFGLSGEQADEALRQMLDGAAATLLTSGLPPAEVMDLIPVRPLEALEPSVGEAYRTALPALYAKIRPLGELG